MNAVLPLTEARNKFAELVDLLFHILLQVGGHLHFGRVDKNLNGHRRPPNVKGFRMLSDGYPAARPWPASRRRSCPLLLA